MKLNKLDDYLVANWRQAWTWVSVNCMLLAGSIQGAWIYIPEDLRSRLPDDMVSGLTVSLLVMGVAGRLWKQPKPKRGKRC